jgi:hypothetical protein
MTSTDDPRDPVPDATDAEALAGALLDGEALPAETAGARADDAAVLEARARFERVARAVATPVPIDDVAREAAIAAALAAATAPAPQGDELARRRRSQGRLRVVGIAAAALVAVAIGAVALGQGGGDDADQAATATAEDRASDEVTDDAGGASTSADAAPSIELSTLDLGAFDDLPALVAAAAASSFGADTPTTMASSGSAAEETGSAGDPTTSAAGCAAPARPAGRLLSSRSATLEGRPVVVVVVDGPEGRIVQVYDFTTCELRFEGSP